nr:uncharacterized protein LOC129436946 [Misgurnus anguillicaudatus]
MINCFSGYGEYAFTITFLTRRRFYRRKSEGSVYKQQHNNAVIIAICLLLSGDIHQCPGPTIVTDEGSIVDDLIRNSTTTQVCSLFRDYSGFETSLQPYTVCHVPYPSSIGDPVMARLSFDLELARLTGVAPVECLDRSTWRGALSLPLPSKCMSVPEGSDKLSVSTDDWPSLDRRMVEPVEIYPVAKTAPSRVVVGCSDCLHATTSSSGMELNDKLDHVAMTTLSRVAVRSSDCLHATASSSGMELNDKLELGA